MNAPLPPIEDLVACPHCDALHHLPSLGENERAFCARCGSLMVAPRARSFLQVLSLAFSAMILMAAAVFFPFLSISSHGFGHASSVFEVAMAFSDSWYAPLSLAVLMVIVALPALRFAGLIYTLWPLANGHPPWRHAAFVFRMVEESQPWSMAEIFVIGTAVALVKIGGLASISFGPAFWAFCCLIIVNVLKNAYMSKSAIWEAIGKG
ncbi:paraquat-inducible protein A [Sinirhodobacter populi]|uniref:Paraquat-inducible protein A n=1 Tax=Paenirhodobacter populi TaxID=2306993 RepID=A0A443KHK5_9RHOB|nr:paraquat-inducible protein A [Sinirhodobacter populi]RWR32216.1 paraquat-inducible protein A [Sinirhodobacter populi]